MTEKTIKALKIVRENYGLTASEFAKKMWPDSDGHNKVTNGGNGAQRGKGMWLAAGSYLAKLRNKELVRHVGVRFYRITRKGESAIAEFENENQ